MITLKLLVWIIFIAGFVYYNWRVIEKKKSRPFYLLDNIAKGFFFILYGVYVWDSQNDIRTVNLALWCFTSFWLLFDLGLNLSRGLSPFYIGKSSGWIDQLGYKYPWGYWILKLLAAYVLVHTTINIYKWN